VDAIKLANPEEIAIFTDDVKWCKNNLPLEEFNVPVMFPQESDWVELMDMIYCKNLIISNSSFGWWAAYLNTHPDKRVYAPSTWFGRVLMAEGFNIHDLVLPEWNII
jgi:hypothetical protein